jgi:flagellar motor protein MotB
MSARQWTLAAACCALAMLCGCMVPRSSLNAAQSHAQALAEQNRALLAELENREEHMKYMQDRLRRAEEDVALMEEKSAPSGGRLAPDYHQPTDSEGRQRRVPSAPSGRLAELVAAYPSLRFDPQTGAARLDTALLFDPGEDQLRDDARPVLRDFAKIVQEAGPGDLKIMIVGHGDAHEWQASPGGDHFLDNWQLSTARALAVAGCLRQSGVPGERIGIAGFAGYRAIAAKNSAADSQRAGGVEIFVMGPDAPIVGWNDATATVYR